jgi:hypothetical protein
VILGGCPREVGEEGGHLCALSVVFEGILSVVDGLGWVLWGS